MHLASPLFGLHLVRQLLHDLATCTNLPLCHKVPPQTGTLYFLPELLTSAASCCMTWLLRCTICSACMDGNQDKMCGMSGGAYTILQDVHGCALRATQPAAHGDSMRAPAPSVAFPATQRAQDHTHGPVWGATAAANELHLVPLPCLFYTIPHIKHDGLPA